MFDIGFWELIIIAVIALLILGPERLPAFARQAGNWLSEIRRLAYNLQKELQQAWPVEEDELKTQRKETNDSAQSAEPLIPSSDNRDNPQ